VLEVHLGLACCCWCPSSSSTRPSPSNLSAACPLDGKKSSRLFDFSKLDFFRGNWILQKSICVTRMFPKSTALPQISFNQPIWGVTIEMENQMLKFWFVV